MLAALSIVVAEDEFDGYGIVPSPRLLDVTLPLVAFGFVSGLPDSPVGGTLLITPGFSLISAAVKGRLLLLPPAVEAVLELLAELTDVVEAVEACPSWLAPFPLRPTNFTSVRTLNLSFGSEVS